ncbi:MAG: phytanoyl-CoA dioxygenase family protein, partial [Planctomycetaceae bacterium]|nr:phytanoyl-CoA dioxygenase family protein [Planctomycetaceae bacterium]
DIRYWSFPRPELISVWIALGQENEQNGCLKIIPGTHQMTPRPEQLDADLFLRPDLPENQPLIDTQQPVYLQPGDALFFHARTFHSASRNHGTNSKFSVVFTFRGGDNPPKPGTRSAALPELLLPPALSASGSIAPVGE